MRIQMDHSKRVIALSNLEAMCKRVSGTCHRYTVAKITPNRVHVEYSNPDEYGNEHPMRAVLPCWKGKQAGLYSTPEDRFIVLEILDVIGDSWDGEGWQAFQALLDCPELFRSNPDTQDWRTTSEILGESLSPEDLTKRIVALAEKHGEETGEPDHAIGDLQEALKLCFDSLSENDRARILRHAKEQAEPATRH